MLLLATIRKWRKISIEQCAINNMINVTNSIFRSRCIIQFLKKLLMCTQIPLSQCSQDPGGLFSPRDIWKKTTHPTWYTIWIRKINMNLKGLLLYCYLDIQKVYKKSVLYTVDIYWWITDKVHVSGFVVLTDVCLCPKSAQNSK